MILEDLYPLLVVVHVMGALLFALAHGVSVAVALRLRTERDLDRVRALLDLSAGTIGTAYASLVLLLVAGLVAAVWHNWLFRYAWPWLALAILILSMLSMHQRGSMYYNAVRRAAGLRTYQDPPDRPAPPVNETVLWRLLRSYRAEELAITGTVALAVTTWLMVAKPF